MFQQNLSNFFAAVAMIAASLTDPFTLDGLTVLDWLEANAAYLAWMEAHMVEVN